VRVEDFRWTVQGQEPQIFYRHGFVVSSNAANLTL
jgi:hypothetical protein